MNKERIENAYKIVFEDMRKNSPSFFFGNYDARHGKESFMFGIATVMEFIAIRADSTEKTYDKFNDEFVKNMVESEKGLDK